jgi:hypothetical protein
MDRINRIDRINTIKEPLNKSSFPRRRESTIFGYDWVPAYARWTESAVLIL